MAQGKYEAAPCVEAVRLRVEAGSAGLRRCAEAWEQCLLEGAFAQVWPVVWSVTEAASTASPLPPGLPELLRLLTAYLHDIVTPLTTSTGAPVQLPVHDGIRALAGARTASASRAEARTFVAAVEAGVPA